MQKLKPFIYACFLCSLLCSVVALVMPGCTAAEKTALNPPLQPYTINVAPASQPAAYITVYPTTAQSAINTAANAVKDVEAVNAVVPTPWTTWISLGGNIILGLLAAYQSYGKGQIQQQVASAAPGLATVVSQATDGVSLATDIQHISQIPAVAQLLATPTAQKAIAAASAATTIIGSISPSAAVPKV